MNSLKAVACCALLSLVCGADPLADIGGTWSITESLSSQTGISCDLTGSLLLGSNSDGSLFEGLRIITTQDCVGAPAGWDITGSLNVFRGEVSGDRVSFLTALCNFDGTLSADTMSGTISCPDGMAGEITDFTGTWQATRTTS